MRINEYGRSMVELLGVLSILFFLTVGGILGYTKAMRQHRANEVINQATLISANLRTVYVSQSSYRGLDNQVAFDLNVFPEDMINEVMFHNHTFDLSTLHNVYRGSVRVAESFRNTPGDGGAFVMSFYGIEREGCMAIATSDWGNGSLSGLMGMHIMGNPETEDNDDVADNMIEGNISRLEYGQAVLIPSDSRINLPLTVAQARYVCSCVTYPTCAITWKYF